MYGYVRNRDTVPIDSILPVPVERQSARLRQRREQDLPDLYGGNRLDGRHGHLVLLGTTLKILFVSKESGAGDLALRLAMEGHDLRYHVVEKDESSNLDGLIEKEKNWRAGVGWCDYAILDDTGMDDISAFLLKAKKPAFGMAYRDGEFGGKSIVASKFATTLEKDRSFSHEIMEHLKIGKPIESLQFSDIAQAIEHLKKHQVPHVIKPEVQGSGSEKTYVGHFWDNSDCIGWLEQLPSLPNAGKIKSIEVEERKVGVEVAASTWFNGKDFVGPPNINFENKKIATHNIGFNTGEAGTSMFYGKDTNRLAKETAYRMGDFLRKWDYRGQLDVNCIVNEEGVWPLEFTPRLGYPASYIEQELHTEWGDFLATIARGEEYKGKFSEDWALGVLLVGEGYPFWTECAERTEGHLIQNLTKENIEHFHLYHVKYEKEKFIATGCLPLVVTGRGKTVAEAKKNVYDLMPTPDAQEPNSKEVYFPGCYPARPDIGDNVIENLKKLKEWGYDMGRSE